MYKYPCIFSVPLSASTAPVKLLVMNNIELTAQDVFRLWTQRRYVIPVHGDVHATQVSVVGLPMADELALQVYHAAFPSGKRS